MRNLDYKTYAVLVEPWLNCQCWLRICPTSHNNLIFSLFSLLSCHKPSFMHFIIPHLSLIVHFPLILAFYVLQIGKFSGNFGLIVSQIPRSIRAIKTYMIKLFRGQTLFSYFSCCYIIILPSSASTSTSTST